MSIITSAQSPSEKQISNRKGQKIIDWFASQHLSICRGELAFEEREFYVSKSVNILCMELIRADVTKVDFSFISLAPEIQQHILNVLGGTLE